MIANYIKVAYRNLLKYKTLSAINILGLALGLCICLLMMATGAREFSFDTFHPNADRIHALYFKTSDANGLRYNRNMPMPLAEVLKDQLPGVEAVTRIQSSGSSIQYEENLIPIGVTYVDADFLKMFHFPIIKGNTNNPLDDVNSVVITTHIAQLLFGDMDPIGKVITEKSGGHEKSFVVSGVTAKTPYTSTVRYHMLVRIENSPDYSNMSWDDFNHQAYAMLGANVEPAATEAGFKPIIKTNLDETITRLENEGVQPHDNGQFISLNLLPLRKMRFATQFSHAHAIPKMFPISMIAVGLMILLIASFNFVNIVLGNSLTRTTEIGIRKVLGASRKHLVSQLFGESLLIIVIATVIALSATYLLLPEFNALFPFPINLSEPFIWISLGIILFIVALVAGGYPAMAMSKYPVVQIIRQSFRGSKPGVLRNSLVIFQFVVALLLIGSALMVTQQLEYLHNRPLGYDSAQVISLPVRGEISGENALTLLRNKLSSQPDIKYISGAGRNLGMGTDGSSYSSSLSFDQDGRNIQVNWLNIDYDIVETLCLSLQSGRVFDPARSSSDSTMAVIINQKLANDISPNESAVGKFLNTEPPSEIIGVVKDFHFKSLKEEIENVALVIDADFPIRYVFLKVSSDNIPKTMSLLKDTWKEIAPRSEFHASLLDENINRQYQQEALLMRIISISAIMAVFLAAMGLFGISLLVVEQRTKEIGIRKVLGASLSTIVQMLSLDFIRPVIIAILIAVPMTWYAMQQWLNSFAYRVEISWWVLLSAGIIAIIIALMTVSVHSLRVALANPVDSLKDE